MINERGDTNATAISQVSPIGEVSGVRKKDKMDDEMEDEMETMEENMNHGIK